MQSVKVFQNLIVHCRQARRDNDLSYLLALRLFDTNKKGWLQRDDYVNNVTTLFGVGQKTVKNNIVKMKANGFISEDNGRLFYISQEKIANMLHIPLTQKAVYVSAENLAGGLVERRAFFESAAIARANKLIVTRDTRKEITGTSKRTQRKYDTVARVKTVQNFALLKEVASVADPHDLYYSEGVGQLFVTKFNGTLWYSRQIANTYESKVTLGIKDIQRQGGINVQLPNVFVPNSRVYFDPNVHELPKSAFSFVNIRANLFWANRP